MNEAIATAAMDLMQRVESDYPGATVLRTMTIVEVRYDGDEFVAWESSTDLVGELHLCNWVADEIAGVYDGEDDDE